MQGWIKLHREILESDLWNDVTTFRLFSYLLLKASHKDGVKIQGEEVNRGQWIRSYRKLAQDLAYKEGRGLKEYSLKTISKCVNKLVKADRVTIQETEQGTLFTIVNYAKYQDEIEGILETGNAIGKEPETKGKRTVNKNKNANNAKNAKEEILIAEIKDLRRQYSSEIQSLIDQYWMVIKKTRTSGKIHYSVILKAMKKWTKFDPVVIQYALKKHIEAYDDGEHKEEYTLGIMRNTSPGQAEDMLNRKSSNGFNKTIPKKDIRDKEIEFQRWIQDGKDPEDFNWKN